MTPAASSVAPSVAPPGAPPLTEGDFTRIASLLRGVAGINLQRGKEGLVRARLSRRLRHLRLHDFAAYVAFVEGERSGGELREMVDALTTNKTSFFREAQHFDYLRASVLPAFAAGGRAPCVWSAGCSSGEEPYTIGMVLRDHLPTGVAPPRILATDISARMLARARAARYPAEQVEELPSELVRRHFARGEDGAWEVAAPVRRTVRFARLNLMGEWPMRGPFDAIFCRNVMIYFDKATQAALVDRFWSLLAEGGHLFVGHSESLTGLQHRFRYVQPAVYAR